MTEYDPQDEDLETVRMYVQHIPSLDSRFRGRLRTQLATLPRPPSPVRMRAWKRWGGLVVAAVTATSAAITIGLGHRAPPASAYQILRSAVSAASSPSDYTGTILVSYMGAPDAAVPLNVDSAIDTYRLRVRFWVASPTRYRVDIRTEKPALQSDEEVVLIHGHTASIYDRSLGVALRGSSDFSPENVLFNLLLPRQSVGEYLFAVKHDNAAAHAWVVGQRTILGHVTDEIRFGPLGRAETCVQEGTHSNPTNRCTRRFYGWAYAWISRDTHMVLRYEEQGVPLASGKPAGFVGRVSRLTAGPRAVARALQYRPPTRPLTFPFVDTLCCSAMGGGAGVGGITFDRQVRQEVRGFPSVAPLHFWATAPHIGLAPRTTSLPLPVAYGIQQGPIPNRTIHVGYLYARHFSLAEDNTSYRAIAPAYAAGAPGAIGPFGFGVRGPWVYVEEQRRRGAMPRELRSEKMQRSGKCRVWSGTYSNGQAWAAVRHRSVIVLAVSNGMVRRKLARYVGLRLCH